MPSGKQNLLAYRPTLLAILVFALAVFVLQDVLLRPPPPPPAPPQIVRHVPARYSASWLDKSAYGLELRDLPREGVRFAGIVPKDAKSWAKIHEVLLANFQRARPRLQRAWSLEGEVLLAAYFTTVVGHLWPAGLPLDPDGNRIPASVGRYTPPNDPWLSVESYLAAPYASCQDFALMLYMLLKQSGIEARHVGYPSHIYLETTLDGRTWVVDPFYGYLTPMTNEELLTRDTQPVTYYVLPFDSDQPKSPRFRERRGATRWMKLLTVGRWGREPKPMTYPMQDDFEAWFPRNAVKRDKTD